MTTTVVFVDPKDGRGGGQVVLEGIMEGCANHANLSIAMPPLGRASIAIPSRTKEYDSLSRAVADATGSVVLVANANASFPAVALTADRLRRQGRRVTTLGIVHNYPSTLPKRLVTQASLARLDDAVVVEPGLLDLRHDARSLSWLSIPEGFPKTDLSKVQRTGVVRSFARPDVTKGLHLLPALFTDAEAKGWRCEVALGSALDGDKSYEKRLRTALAPWLVDGRRTVEWIAPGDVLIVPSISGEAACLTAQEASARGAHVVASRIGLMPYLQPALSSLRTFPVGDMRSASICLDEIAKLSDAAFATACVEGSEAIHARAGLWYNETVAWILGAAQA